MTRVPLRIASWLIVWLLLFVMPTTAPAGAATQQREMPLEVTGCLLLSRLPGVFALHMDYNRIAVMGHPDLANYVRHQVRLTGEFEARAGGLRFIVDEIVELAPNCETVA